MYIQLFSQEDLEKGSNLVILVGPPACGKSTLADKLSNEIPNCSIVCPDDIRMEIMGDEYNSSRNPEVFEKVYSRLGLYLENGCNVIYDATNCRTSYRYRIMNACSESVNKVVCLMSTKSLSECLENNRKKLRVLPDRVIEKMYLTLMNHPPTLLEGYDIIMRLDEQE